MKHIYTYKHTHTYVYTLVALITSWFIQIDSWLSVLVLANILSLVLTIQQIHFIVIQILIVLLIVLSIVLGLIGQIVHPVAPHGIIPEFIKIVLGILQVSWRIESLNATRVKLHANLVIVGHVVDAIVDLSKLFQEIDLGGGDVVRVRGCCNDVLGNFEHVVVRCLLTVG